MLQLITLALLPEEPLPELLLLEPDPLDEATVLPALGLDELLADPVVELAAATTWLALLGGV